MNTFNRPGEQEIPAERYGVKADGVTDDAPAIQTLIDAVEEDTKGWAEAGNPAVPGPKVIRFPRGRVRLGAPIVMGTQQFTALAGDPSGLTHFVPQFGSGHTLVVDPRRRWQDGVYEGFGLDLEPSLVLGPGNALRLGTGRFGVDLSSEPKLDLTGLTELTVSYFFRRTAPRPEAAVHVHSGNHVFADPHDCFGIWDYFGRMAVYWGNTVARPTDVGVAEEVGVTYFVALTFKNSTVTLWVGEPGQTATAVVSFVVPSPLIPAWSNGLDRFCIGYNGKGPDCGQLRSHNAPEMFIDGLHVSGECLYDAPFTCPTIKPTAGPSTRLCMNFEQRGPFLYGQSSGAGAYIFPNKIGDTQGRQHRLSDLMFEGHQGSSGPLLYGAVFSTLERIRTLNTWEGITFRGSTFGGRFQDIWINANSVGWCQTTQSMMSTVNRLHVERAAILSYFAGSVGGHFDFVGLTPSSQTRAAVVVDFANEVHIANCQLDDEGQSDPAMEAPVHVIGGTLVVDRGIITRSSPGVLVKCVGGGAFDSRAWLNAPDSTTPMLHFSSRPHSLPDVRPSKRSTTAPLTNHPEWLQFNPSPASPATTTPTPIGTPA